MHLSRIAELLKPFLSPTPCHSERLHREESAGLSETQLQNISTYIDILRRWNARINLTAIRDEEEIVTRHFGESFFAARQLFARPSPAFLESEQPSPRSGVETRDSVSVADLGSGAGFPGIPIKLWAPNVALRLIESNRKKATFLREVARAITLTDIDIQNVRAETLPRATYNVVTLRAVERFADALPMAARLLAPAGRVALLIGDPQVDLACSTLPSLTWDPPILIPESQSRVLLIGHAEP